MKLIMQATGTKIEHSITYACVEITVAYWQSVIECSVCDYLCCHICML